MNANRFPYLRHDGFIAIAHRGGASAWPENSMRAFAGAVELGYAYIETDVHVSRDGVLLAFHDDVLDRVTDRRGRIRDLDYREIREARIAGTEPIPLLDELLETWPALKINIDPKHDDAVMPLCESIKRHAAIDRVCVGSFSGARIARARAVLGETLCTSMGPLEVLKLRLAGWCLPAGRFAAACAQVAPRHYGIPVVDRGTIRALRRRGMQMHVWTIDDREQMAALIELGVDAIMTDEPALLKQVLEERGLWVA